MESEAFAKNPIGVDFDPEELYQRLQTEGEAKLVEEAKHRPDIGPRGIDDIPQDFLN
jgi:hypothetical protein